MRVRPGSPPESTGLRSGSTATASNAGLRCFRVCATPVTVPPVPTPATSASTRPSVSSQISTAVVSRCTAGLAGLSNCCGTNACGISRASCAAVSTAPRMPRDAGVSTRRAPKARSVTRRSGLKLSGITSTHA